MLYADLEIRIRKCDASGYPVEITLDHEQTLGRGTLSASVLPLVPSAGYYFDGVCSNVTEGEQELMCVLAERAEGAWTPAELTVGTGQSEQALSDVLQLLHRHDVILDAAGGVRFASELMRRWVAEYQKKE